MSLPTNVGEAAASVLTPRQFEVWLLEQYGMSQRQIAVAHMVSRSTIRDHLDAAHRKLFNAGVCVNSKGQWYIKEAA